jgi:hypothetical protein
MSKEGDALGFVRSCDDAITKAENRAKQVLGEGNYPEFSFSVQLLHLFCDEVERLRKGSS